MGRPPNRQRSEKLEITLPVSLYEHLTALAAESYLGANESAVAVALIVAQLEERERNGLARMHLRRISPPDRDAD